LGDVPDLAFKDLCFDVTAGGGRAAEVVSFWSAALGQAGVAHEWGDYHLDPPPGGPRERTIWVNNVAEAPAGKSRVHLDLRLPDGDPAPLVAAGARIVRLPTDDDRWYVLEDPDGIPLCVMGPHPTDPDAPFGPFELVVDAADPEGIARWWADRTGGTFGYRPERTFAWVEGAAGFPFSYWVFTQVPERKTAKNRVHWDVKMVDADVELLQERGAILLRPKDDEIEWWVMADPEGNEFCAFR
jgi:Glyoxalase-like domain